MTDFSKILDKAKELEEKMKESQERIKKIEVVGVSGADAVKITLNGEGEMVKLHLSDEILKEDKSIIEDLISAAHNNAKSKLKLKDITGVKFNPLADKWDLSDDKSVNYISKFKKI